MLRRILIDALAERFDVFGLQRDTRRHGMSAEFDEQVAARADGFKQRETLNASAAALRLCFAARNDHARLAAALRHTGRHNADNTMVPVFTVHHDHAVFHVSFRFDIRKRRFGNLCFHTAAFLVIGANFLTQYLGFLFIAADEQAHGAFRRAHTARRVDARHKRKRHIRARQCLPCNACVFQKCLHARAVAL